jgi:site-specific recombinase XerD
MLSKNISYPACFPTSRKASIKHPEIDGFKVHLIQQRGVQPPKRQLDVATCFLDFLATSGKQITSVNQKDIDDFISEQGAHYKRKTLSAIASFLRSFFRYLFFAGILDRDFSESVHRPYMFNGERDPQYLKPWQIQQILSLMQKDNTVMGKRNYAILMLLAIYGLRGSEVSALRLDDLCWRTRKLTIRKRKCGDSLVLPLVPQVGQAIADYLSLRPVVKHREIFVATFRPFNPLKSAYLSVIVQSILSRCGINIPHPGTHTFRFSNAQSLFQAERPLAEIAGILGHKDFRTTLGYLSFVVHPLREVAINDGEEIA